LTQQTVFTTNDLTNGSHTLKVVKSSGWFMLLDRLDVLQRGSSTRRRCRSTPRRRPT